MSQLMLNASRVFCRRSAVQTAIGKLRSSSTFQAEANKFMQRHAKRNSPLSPYMLGTTYKCQLTSMLSITHRITGLGLSILLYGVGIAELANSKLSFEQILRKIGDTFPSALLDATKLAAGASIIFHTFNGVRHLAWDAGYGFKIVDLYKSGYAVIGITIVGLALLAAQIAAN